MVLQDFSLILQSLHCVLASHFLQTEYKLDLFERSQPELGVLG